MRSMYSAASPNGRTPWPSIESHSVSQTWSASGVSIQTS